MIRFKISLDGENLLRNSLRAGPWPMSMCDVSVWLKLLLHPHRARDTSWCRGQGSPGWWECSLLGHSVHTLAARIKQVLVWFLQCPDYGRELGAQIVSGTGSGVIIRPVWKLRGRDRALYVRGRPDFRDFLSPSFPFLINPLHNLNPLTGIPLSSQI